MLRWLIRLGHRRSAGGAPVFDMPPEQHLQPATSSALGREERGWGGPGGGGVQEGLGFGFRV